MTRVSQPLPDFLGGVSQQPYVLRAPNQAEDQINASSSTVAGLVKRNPSEFIADLGAASVADAKIHTFNRDSVEQGAIIIPGDGTISIVDNDGAAQTVNNNAPNLDYIDNVADPEADLEIITLADYTFIVNKTVTPAMTSNRYFDATTSAGGYFKAGGWVRAGLTHAPYTVRIYSDSTKATLQITATYTPGSATNAATTNIAQQLTSQINGVSGYTCTQYGSTFFFHNSGASDFYIEMEDGAGNEGMVMIDRALDDPTKLPPTALDRYQIEIVGDTSTDYDNYWVEYDPQKNTWLEIPEPNRLDTIDSATMPHVISYVSPGVYAYDEIDWDDCFAGDTTTNPEPSFIGNPIKDIFYYADRLGFMTNKSVIMSQAGDLFNFFRSTVTQFLASAPVDVEVTMRNPAPLAHAVEHDDTVFFTNDRAQFSIDTQAQIITPQTFRIRQTSAYKVDTLAAPVSDGSRLYFPTRNGDFAGLLEYSSNGVDGDGRTTYQGVNVFKEAPRYVNGRLRKIQPTISEDTGLVALVTDQDDENLYIYQYKMREDGLKLQNAVHRWTWDTDVNIKTTAIDGNQLFLIMAKSDGTYLEKLNLSPLVVDSGLAIKILLDHRMDETQVTSATYNAGTGKTTIILPLNEAGDEAYVVYGRLGSTLVKPGELAQITTTSTSPLTFTVDGDWESEPFYVGKNYRKEWEFSPIVYRDRRDGTAKTAKRLQLKRLIVNYGQTGYLSGDVTAQARTSRSVIFNGMLLGTSETVIGAIPLADGALSIPVKTQNLKATLKLVNDKPFPSRVLSGEWRGDYGLTTERTVT